MNETLSTEMQGKQEISHLTKLNYFHNTKLWLGPSSLKIQFYNHHQILWTLYGRQILQNREKKEKA